MIGLTSSFLLLLLLLSTTSPVASSATHRACHRNPDIVHRTCHHSAATDPNVNYTLCVESLGSSPKSKSANLRGLALLSLRLAKAEAKRAKARAKEALREVHDGGDRYLESCLATCLELYAGANAALGESIKMVKQGKYGDANVHVSGSVDAPGVCEGSFKEGGRASPLGKENHRLFQLTLSITSMNIVRALN
ncbi:putative invertase inhibitor [Zingiber officinale]|uniref:Pectinesterase inhibitor domain-containing protein n=1 Tax=Zingiber officinale TaxID=94328 RepID=A0A8J5HIM3_ZINOF|nr:putative invertase inhibitor [Zingiber officinale]KAG6520158.1 hypothetical protein ZIOFF_017195 [Zingiber officinale]